MIEVQHLTKRYRERVAVDDLTFSLEEGQVLGFLGPNGAGKSTTMKMLTGFLPPSEGTAKVAGFVVFLGFKEGERVKAGQELVKLDTAILDAELKQAMADLGLARDTNERLRSLVSRGSGTQVALDESAAKLASSEARVQLAKAKLAQSTILAPFNAWVVLKALETLELRAYRQSENAMEVARFLEGRVPEVLHPGLPSHPQHELCMRQMSAAGPIFAIVLDGGREQAMGLLNALELIDISNNIGDSRSLCCHPASTTHYGVSAEARADMGVVEGMLRINIGLEDPRDVIADLDQALTRVGL